LLVANQAIIAQMNGFATHIDSLDHTPNKRKLSAFYDMSNGLKDVTRLYASCGDFVQHRLKQMVIVHVYQKNLNTPFQPLGKVYGGAYSSKSSAEDYNLFYPDS